MRDYSLELTNTKIFRTLIFLYVNRHLESLPKARRSSILPQIVSGFFSLLKTDDSKASHANMTVNVCVSEGNMTGNRKKQNWVVVS